MQGVDALPKADGTVMLIESNTIPSMEINRPKLQMAQSVLRLLFGVLKGGGEVDEDMTQVWTLPLDKYPK